MMLEWKCPNCGKLWSMHYDPFENGSKAEERKCFLQLCDECHEWYYVALDLVYCLCCNCMGQNLKITSLVREKK